MYLFNVRVYGILVNENNEVLISDEKLSKVAFTKFPGGGLEYGEGLIDALKREFMEECELEVEVLSHLYTTDFYEKSSFNESQILSIYYQIKAVSPITFELKKSPFDFSNEKQQEKMEVFRFIPIADLQEDDLTFKTDKAAWNAFKRLQQK
ncbi:NUDIX domain-containing protein [Sphingobacterium psychroaquaticum]|uniref:ADP-ribose pyrophosphatase YjhB, NUDIX family n=1 Tax=Sphingobacterium psychroaquaticum TaxID=561061 RepID=A0A1X7L4Q9_9SPHI|nr:NUDIX domain-containing protein [Sphingobacterium psychroaquaticum]QBQ42269.1 NUDIX domain-containing protein [Sphingobacterium psychroaquaticum]SMG48750.1 ADP-ribose pyrophosphatase YjhB, NUDIX family [Sphingobacterium psychroaquaticum]